MKSILLLGVTSLLSACAATGFRYSEHPASTDPVPAHSARLVVYRTGENAQYALRAAALKLDGSDVGYLAIGGFKTYDVSPGTHTLTVDMWDAPGQCELPIQVEGGSGYFFEVSPRVASFAAGLPGAVIPFGTLGGLLLTEAASLGGMAVESAGKQCGGGFSIVPVEQSLALPKVAELRGAK